MIEDYLKEKKIEDARKAGVYIGTEEPKQTFTEDDFLKENKSKKLLSAVSEPEILVDAPKFEIPKKKKRGRPKKNKEKA